MRSSNSFARVTKIAGFLVSTMAVTAAPMFAGPLSDGLGGLGGRLGLGGGGLNASANVGGVSASASIGGGSVANGSVSVGNSVSGSATVGGTGNVAAANVNVGGTAAAACVGKCGTTTTPVTPGTPTPNSVAISTASAAPPVVPKRLPCAAKTGNTTALNGYQLIDKSGRSVGIVHSATLGSDMAIHQVAIQSYSKTCVSLSGNSFKVTGYVVRGAFDASRHGLVTR
jgi:hypothetical protein